MKLNNKGVIALTTKVREYIGSRYVPIFGRKDEESIIWDNSKPYEPLSIVLYQGNSYTSRQFVPIGIDILNEEFWAQTGNYNAQVEQYRQEVLALINKLGDLDKKKYIEVMYANDEENSQSLVTLLRMKRSEVDLKSLAIRNIDYTKSYEYAKTQHNMFLVNGQFASPTISNGVVTTNTDPGTSEYWYFFGIQNGQPKFLKDKNHEYTGNDLLALGYTLAFGMRDPLIINGLPADISEFSDMDAYDGVMTAHSSRAVLGFDDNYWYILLCSARQNYNRGMTRDEVIAFLMSFGIPNAIDGDAGGSVQAYLTDSPWCITTIGAHNTEPNEDKMYKSPIYRRHTIPSMMKFEFKEA